MIIQINICLVIIQTNASPVVDMIICVNYVPDACLCSSVLLCIGDTDMLMGLTRMFCIFMYSDVWQFEQTPAV